MEHDEGDYSLELLLQTDVPQLGCIDDLMNNINTSNPVRDDNDQLLGFDQAVAETNINNEEAIIQDNNLAMSHDHTKKKIMRRTPCRWTKEEQSQFEKALKEGFEGNWKKVSEVYIPSRTPSQITSHAQKYFQRKNNTHKKRKSINDLICNVDTYDHASSSSSSSCSLQSSMVNYDHQMMMSPPVHQVVQSDDQSSSTPLQLPPPRTTSSTHMHGNGMMMRNYYEDMMTPAALYYANRCLELENQMKNLMTLMMTNNMPPPPPPPQLCFPAGAAINASTFGGVNQLGLQQPYVQGTTSTSHHQPAGLQPAEDQPLVHPYHPHHHQAAADHPPNHPYY